MLKSIIKFFDKSEDRVRSRLSRYPIVYGIIGGIGVVLFWRGVWHTTDYIVQLINAQHYGLSSIDWAGSYWWDGPVSFLLGLLLLLMSGIFVSSFIGNEMIITGLRGEKKLSEKTERELKTDTKALADIRKEMREVAREVGSLKRKLKAQKPK